MLQCGADYVKIQATAPRGLASAVGQRCASFDGDADRLIYFEFVISLLRATSLESRNFERDSRSKYEIFFIDYRFEFFDLQKFPHI